MLLLPAVVAVMLVRDHLPGESRRAQTRTGFGAILGLLALILMVVVFTHIDPHRRPGPVTPLVVDPTVLDPTMLDPDAAAGAVRAAVIGLG